MDDVRIKVTCKWCSETAFYSVEAIRVVRYSHGLFGYEYFCRSCYVYDCRPASVEAGQDLLVSGCDCRWVKVSPEFFDNDIRHHPGLLAPASEVWVNWWVSRYLAEDSAALMDAEVAALELKDMGDDNERSRP